MQYIGQSTWFGFLIFAAETILMDMVRMKQPNIMSSASHHPREALNLKLCKDKRF
jgi:hypothetical protein